MPAHPNDTDRAVLLVNLGSPDSTSTPAVRRYLRQFLMDERVLDVPYPIRKLIVELFILPFRPAQSAEAYRQIWTEEGSPLVHLTDQIAEALQDRLPIPVAYGMRYGNPSIEHGIRQLLQRESALDRLYLIPLYPHYAMATYETVVEETKRILHRIAPAVKLDMHPPFYNDAAYIRALTQSAEPYLTTEYDHLLFSYHGIPERHCRKTDPSRQHCFQSADCCDVASPAHATCYRHQVLSATQAFVDAARIPEDRYSIAFQSRLGKDAWLKPFTADELVRLAGTGIKRLLVICPAFVSDCLETLEEIGIRGRESFIAAGGDTMELIPCLNVHPAWVDTLAGWCDQN